ncbi:MAG: hypothetical protein ACREQM_06580 [Candidatus Dormibacteraceae bacterium]
MLSLKGMSGLGGKPVLDALNSGVIHGLGGIAASLGSVGGQCVVFLENLFGVHWPVAFASQMANLVTTTTPTAGDIGVSTIPPYGHVFEYVGNGLVLDSNWVAPEIIGEHSLAGIPDVVGYFKPGGNAPSLAGLPGALDPAAILSGLLNAIGIGLSALPSWLGSMPRGLLNMISGGVAKSATSSLGNVGSWVGATTGQFDRGGILPPGLTIAYNGTGKGETVRTADQEAKLGRGDINVYVQAPVPRPAEVARQMGRELGLGTEDSMSLHLIGEGDRRSRATSALDALRLVA